PRTVHASRGAGSPQRRAGQLVPSKTAKKEGTEHERHATDDPRIRLSTVGLRGQARGKQRGIPPSRRTRIPRCFPLACPRSPTVDRRIRGSSVACRSCFVPSWLYIRGTS